MPRLLDPTIKNELLLQLKQGHSINHIVKALGIGKSTIYHHYRKLNGKKYIAPQFIPQASETEGEICGIFAGDGSQYFEPKNYGYEVNVHFGGHKRAYADYVDELYRLFFNKKFILSEQKSGTLRLKTKSKPIFHYFKNYLEYISSHKHDTVRLKERPLTEAFKKGFLRGLIDTDGSVLRDKHGRRRVQYHTTSETLATQIHHMLTAFNVESTIQHYRHALGFKLLYRVNIRSRSIDTFLKTIKPFKGRGW